MAAASSYPLHVDTVSGLDPALVRVCGDLDIESAPSLRALLVPLLPRRVEMDLTDVTFIDSSGVNVLLSHHRHCREAGGRLTVIQSSKTVQQIFQLLGVDELLMNERDDGGSRDRWGDPPDTP